MEILTAKATRRSTRVRVEFEVTATSLDRMRPFAEKCTVLVVSAQGCGMRSSKPLAEETPIMMTGLPGGGSVTARVANCVPLGSDGKSFLIGLSLYSHGNVWGVANPPEDWKFSAAGTPSSPTKSAPAAAPQLKVNQKAWPYNLFDDGAEQPAGRK